jgi:lipopolysaccharide export system permease protein
MFLTYIDRQLVRGYLKAYVGFFACMVSLWIVVDLFTNLDDFTHRKSGLKEIGMHVLLHYGYRTPYIFDQICEAIVLLAAMFTVAWMQRNNELLPLLSAGVSTRRVVAPVLLGACALLSLAALNQELLIPRVSARLFQPRDDPDGDKDIEVQGAADPNGVHLEGRWASRKHRIIKDFHCVIPPDVAGDLITIGAKEARYLPPGDGPHTGGWLLTGAQPADLPKWDNPALLEMIDPGKYFLHTSEVDFDMLTRARNWFQFASTSRLHAELQRADPTRLAPIAVLFHMRLTRPILGIILVFLGLSVILRDQNRNIFVSAGLCLIICAVFFGACFTCRSLGSNEYLSPAFAAWLPVMVFGPVSIAMFDAVHT